MKKTPILEVDKKGKCMLGLLNYDIIVLMFIIIHYYIIL